MLFFFVYHLTFDIQTLNTDLKLWLKCRMAFSFHHPRAVPKDVSHIGWSSPPIHYSRVFICSMRRFGIA